MQCRGLIIKKKKRKKSELHFNVFNDFSERLEIFAARELELKHIFHHLN